MARKESGSGKLTDSFIASADVVSDLYCEVCADFDKQLGAKGFCVECGNYLCSGCIKAHGTRSPSRNHVIKTKDQIPCQKPSSPLSRSTKGSSNEKCDQHPDRMIEYYCRDEGSLACIVCLVKHRQCKAVDHISDISEHLLDSQEYQEFTSSLTSLNADSNEVIKNAKENTTQAEKLCTDVSEALKKLREKVMRAFDTLEGNMLKKIEEIKSADVKNMKEITDMGAEVLDQVDKISTDLQTRQGKNELAQLFVKMIKLEGRIETLHQILHQMDVDNNVTAYKFEPSTGVQGIIDDPASIGSLTIQAADNKATAVQKKPTSQKTTATQKKPAHQKLPESHPAASNAPSAMPAKSTDTSSAPSNAFRDVKVEKVKDINIRTKTDTYGCYITGSVLLPGDEMILADNDNSKLKLLDLQTSKITAELSAPKPWNVASITGNQVVATLFEAREIMFVTVASSLTKERIIKVGGKCAAILHNNGKLLVSFCEPVKIEIMALDGTVEKKIDSPDMFQWPHYMVLSPGNDTIFVSDSRGQCVKRLSLTGVQEAQYEGEELDCPRGVALDQQGRLIVCGWGSHNIYLLTEDLAKIKMVVDYLSYPESLSLCFSTGRLYVGREEDEMSVYQLS